MYLSVSTMTSSGCRYILNAGYFLGRLVQGATGPYWSGDPFADQSCLLLVY